MSGLATLAEQVYIDESAHGDSVYQTITGTDSDVKAYWRAYRTHWNASGHHPVASEPTTVGDRTTMHISRYKESE